jgi:transposase
MLPDPTQLRLITLTTTKRGITAVVATKAAVVPCPVCGHPATRRQSRSTRSVADVPWQGVPFHLELHVRRFFCDQSACSRHLFTERLPGLLAPAARRTRRLVAGLRAVGFACGGRAGARLLQVLGLPTGADTRVREMRRAPVPAARACSVVSVAEWCRRRGQTYGAILVDRERQRVVDLLPDREAATFAAWLQSQTQICVISRARGATCAEGATRGAAQAIQVADRFPIVKQRVEALQHVLGRDQAALRAVSGTGRLRHGPSPARRSWRRAR